MAVGIVGDDQRIVRRRNLRKDEALGGGRARGSRRRRRRGTRMIKDGTTGRSGFITGRHKEYELKSI